MNPLLVAMLALNLNALDWIPSFSGRSFSAQKIGDENPGIDSRKRHASSGLPIDSADSLTYPYNELSTAISFSAGFFYPIRIVDEVPGVDSWKRHAPSGFPVDSIDSLTYRYSESLALALEIEAGYRGFWFDVYFGGRGGSAYLDDSAGEVFGFINNYFNDASLSLGYDLRSKWPLASVIGVFVRAGHLGTKTEYSYRKYVEAEESCGDGLFYAGAGIRAKIPWVLVSYQYPLSSGGLHRLLVSVGGTSSQKGKPPVSVYYGAYYDQSWNSRNNLSTFGCLLSSFVPGW